MIFEFCSKQKKTIEATTLTSTYDTGKMPLRLAMRPSNQLSSTRRVRLTSSPLFNDSSIADWAWKLNFARAWPSAGFRPTGARDPSREMICEQEQSGGVMKSENVRTLMRYATHVESVKSLWWMWAGSTTKKVHYNLTYVQVHIWTNRLDHISLACIICANVRASLSLALSVSHIRL